MPKNSPFIGLKSLSENKLKLFSLLLKEEGVYLTEEQAIPRRNKSHLPPLSYGQEGLWFLSQSPSTNASYNVPIVMRLEGTLDIASLQRALSEVVRRHEILRTTFPIRDGRPAQVISLFEAAALPLIDICEVDMEKREREALRLTTSEAQKPFNLAQGPAIRATLLKLSDREYVLLIVMHHIITDGWSNSVLIGELATLYYASSKGEPSPLAELPIQFADFALWERERLTEEVIAAHLNYWKRQLSEMPRTLLLPTDFPASAVKSYKGASVSITFPRSLSDSFRTLCNREKVTLFVGLLATFKALLCRYTGEEDIVVGAPVAGRSRAETQSLIGCFVNLLVLRTNVSGNPTFRELLGRVRDVSFGAFDHQELPYAKIVDAISWERGQTPIPLIQVLFSYDEAAQGEIELPGLKMSGLMADRGTINADMNMFIAGADQELVTSLRYSADLFKASTVARMLGHYGELLTGILRNPDIHLFDIPISTQEESNRFVTQPALADKYANNRFSF